MFDSKTREDFFDEIWASWPKDWRAVDFKERAKDLFRSFVENEDWLKTFQEAFDTEKPKVTLTVFIRNLAKKHDKPLGAKSTVQCNTLKELNPVVSGVKTDPKALEIFQEVRAVWPVNSDYPESLEAAKKAWFLACETTPVEDLRDATLAYCEDWDTGKLQSRHPYLMKNFVVNEERLEEWLFKAKHKPRPEEREIFEVFWGWYPTFEKKTDKEVKDDSFHYFNRMVKPEEYWAFMIALRAYRSERRDRIFEDDSEEGGKYTRSFIKFVKDWDSTGPRTAATMGELVLKDFLAACIKYGIDRDHVWIEELGGHIQNIQINNVDGISTPRNVRETVKETLRRMCDFDGQKVVLDLDKVTEEILANAWKRSCKPKAKVVELDSL